MHKCKMQLHYDEHTNANARKQMTYLLTWGLRPIEIKCQVMSGEIVQPVQPPAQHLTQVFPLCLIIKYIKDKLST
jgi:hypothetical protein